MSGGESAPTAPTIVDVPRGVDGAGATQSGESSGTTQAFATTPAKALLLAEIERTRTFCLFLIPLVISAAGVAFLVGGDRLAQWLNAGGMATAAVAATAVLLATRAPERYRVWHNVAFGQACIVALTAAMYYWGPFSAVLLIVPFGAHIFTLVESLLAAVLITINLMISHAVLSLLMIFDVITDRGVVAMPDIGTVPQLIILLLLQAIFVATFAVTRELRRSSQRSVEELDEFARAVARRDALLAEARQDLYQALRVGGPGPYTGHTVGSYELGTILGRGAMGEIYEARHTDNGEAFAVKLLNPRIPRDSTHYRRFVREAEIAASIDVPNVVRVVDIGTGDGAPPYLAMERLRGQDLSRYLKNNPRMPMPEVLHMIEQVGAGLSAAHEAGVIHRDLKPQNLFRAVDDEGGVTWKILDFGVSKLADGEGTLTQGKVVGTPSYMAPEQARGLRVDHRADLYSLGVIAYRAITGIPAFATDRDVPRMLYDVVHTMPQRPSAVARVHEAMDVVMAVAMAKNPNDRFRDAHDLALAIAAAHGGTVSNELLLRGRAILLDFPWRLPPRVH